MADRARAGDMNARRLLALLATAGCIFAATMTPARAQDAGLRAQVISVSGDVYPYAKAVVGIEDASGESPRLGADAFRVTVGAAPANVQSAELAASEDAPLDALVVFDTSGSMEGAPLSAARSSAKALLAELAPQDRVAIMEFGDDVRLLQDYTSDRAALEATIDGLVAQGNTALYDATAQAANKAAASTASRRAVVLLSDGADFGGRSQSTREQATAAAAASGVPFFAIAFGSDLDRPYLEGIAGASGGRFLEAPTPDDLEALYVGIGRMLRSQYIVTFDASGAPATDADIEITVDAGGRTATAAGQLHLDASFAPPLVVDGIAAGDTVTGDRTVSVTTATGAAPTRVRWYIDGTQVFESVAAPFAYRFDPREAGAGARTLRIEADFGPLRTQSEVAFDAAPAAGGGGLPLLPIAGAGAGALALGGAAAWWFLLRRRAMPAGQRLEPLAGQMKAAAGRIVLAMPEPEPVVEAEPIGEPMGALISRSGTDIGREYVVGGRPVSIGYGERCGVRVDDPALATEEARIWVRGGHLLVHRMVRLSVIVDNGTSGGWTILEPGDTFDIGAHRFEFKLLPAGESTASIAPPETVQDGEPADPPKKERTARAVPAPPRADAPSNVTRFSDLMGRNSGGYPEEKDVS